MAKLTFSHNGRVSIDPNLSRENLNDWSEEYQDADDVIRKGGKGPRVLHVLLGELDRLSHHDTRFGDKFGVLGDLNKEREMILSQLTQRPIDWEELTVHVIKPIGRSTGKTPSLPKNRNVRRNKSCRPLPNE